MHFTTGIVGTLLIIKWGRLVTPGDQAPLARACTSIRPGPVISFPSVVNGVMDESSFQCCLNLTRRSAAFLTTPDRDRCEVVLSKLVVLMAHSLRWFNRTYHPHRASYTAPWSDAPKFICLVGNEARLVKRPPTTKGKWKWGAVSLAPWALKSHRSSKHRFVREIKEK